MKISLIFVTLAATTLMACSHNNSTTSTPALPQPSDKAASGKVNGQTGDFSLGTYTISPNASGKLTYTIELGSTTCGMGPSTSGIMVTAPAQVGTYTFPDGLVQFYFSDADGVHETMNGNSMIKILTDNGLQVTGAVASTDGNSSVDGTFTATNCSPQTPVNGVGVVR